jgi:hypothetical protein
MNQTYKRRETYFFYLDETANKFDEYVIEGDGSRTGRMGGIENFYENKTILFCFFPLPGFTRETILLSRTCWTERKIISFPSPRFRKRNHPSPLAGRGKETPLRSFMFHPNQAAPNFSPLR